MKFKTTKGTIKHLNGGSEKEPSDRKTAALFYRNETIGDTWWAWVNPILKYSVFL